MQITFPGVYLQEVPGGTRTISPVSTAITAFLGRAPTGPTDVPVTISDFGDYVRIFGGLAVDCPMSYAVEGFFLNGGLQAVIGRLFEPGVGDGVAQLHFGPGPKAPPQDDAVPAAGGHATGAPTLTLRAASPGSWGNRLAASVDLEDISERSVEALRGHGLSIDDLFNLTLVLRDRDGKIAASERFANVTLRSDGDAGPLPNRLDRVLTERSNFARVVSLPALPPANGALATGAGGDDGTPLKPDTFIGDPVRNTGLFLLDRTDVFNLLCIPPDGRMLPDVPAALQDLPAAVRQAAARFCADRRALFLVDPPLDWSHKQARGEVSGIDPGDLGIGGQTAAGIEVACNAAVYFPRVYRPDPLMKDQPALFPPCGMVAGVMAANDVARGVWKAPAGTDAGLAGVSALEFSLNDRENGQLNPLGINCLRSFPVTGPVVWGARTLRGADRVADDYKYVPVRRLALFIESSIVAGTQWAVFEQNDEKLWSALRLAVGSFLADLSRQGAFNDYAVKCDDSTTSANDIALGTVNMLASIAPTRPGEFLTIAIRQAAGPAPG